MRTHNTMALAFYQAMKFLVIPRYSTTRHLQDALALMWKMLVNGTKSLAAKARCRLQGAQQWSRPIRVATHAIADVRLTKADLIAENALLRQQLIAARRHLGRPLLSKPEKVGDDFVGAPDKAMAGHAPPVSARYGLALAPRDVPNCLVEEVAAQGQVQSQARPQDSQADHAYGQEQPYLGR